MLLKIMFGGFVDVNTPKMYGDLNISRLKFGNAQNNEI